MTSRDETSSGEKGRSPAVFLIFGLAATLIVTALVVLALVVGGHALSKNAALIGAVVGLGGVFTAQLVGIAIEDVRTRETRELEAQRAREAAQLENRRAREVALQRYFVDVGELLIEKPLLRSTTGGQFEDSGTCADFDGVRGAGSLSQACPAAVLVRIGADK